MPPVVVFPEGTTSNGKQLSMNNLKIIDLLIVLILLKFIFTLVPS